MNVGILCPLATADRQRVQRTVRVWTVDFSGRGKGITAYIKTRNKIQSKKNGVKYSTSKCPSSMDSNKNVCPQPSAWQQVLQKDPKAASLIHLGSRTAHNEQLPREPLDKTCPVDNSVAEARLSMSDCTGKWHKCFITSQGCAKLAHTSTCAGHKLAQSCAESTCALESPCGICKSPAGCPFSRARPCLTYPLRCWSSKDFLSTLFAAFNRSFLFEAAAFGTTRAFIAEIGGCPAPLVDIRAGQTSE